MESAVSGDALENADICCASAANCVCWRNHDWRAVQRGKAILAQVRVVLFSYSCDNTPTAGCLSFGPIEFLKCFCDLCVREKARPLSACATH